jgi:hypothetical protein
MECGLMIKDSECKNNVFFMKKQIKVKSINNANQGLKI